MNSSKEDEEVVFLDDEMEAIEEELNQGLQGGR